jgi:nucleotide-binding universal stress UspA family protein
MNLRTILVAFDGSKPAERAVAVAEGLAQRYSARIVLVAVVPDIVSFSAGPLGAVGVPSESDRERAAQDLAMCAEGLGARGRQAETRLEMGAPATMLLRAADAVDADLLVAGRTGKGAVARLVLGSVTTALLHHSSKPILVVP